MSEIRHHRFSYPENPCLREANGHECDLPNGHTTRDQCGECGGFFDGQPPTLAPPVQRAGEVPSTFDQRDTPPPGYLRGGEGWVPPFVGELSAVPSALERLAQAALDGRISFTHGPDSQGQPRTWLEIAPDPEDPS